MIKNTKNEHYDANQITQLSRFCTKQDKSAIDA